MIGQFSSWQPRYAEHGIATFPVRGKRPAVRGYLTLGLGASRLLADKFVDANGIGFALGRKSRITVLDVDTPDERVLAAALDRHGRTPIIVRTGSGNFHGWFLWNGEGRRIRPFEGQPIDLLGQGYVVAPPSTGEKVNYEFVRGGLADLERLTVMRNLPPDIDSNTPPSRLSHNERVREGGRNDNLFDHCMRAARHCDDFDALLDVARTQNEQFLPPLPDDEVAKTATSVWGYTQRGDNRFGQAGVFFPADEANNLIRLDQDAFVLLAFLRANNGPGRTFMIANGMSAIIFGWSRKRFAAARGRLEGRYVKLVRPASKQNGPALYRWVFKGGRNLPPILNLHSPPLIDQDGISPPS
jgi:hypothetical protein